MVNSCQAPRSPSLTSRAANDTAAPIRAICWRADICMRAARRRTVTRLSSEFSFKPVDFVAKPPLEDLFGLGGI